MNDSRMTRRFQETLVYPEFFLPNFGRFGKLIPFHCRGLNGIQPIKGIHSVVGATSKERGPWPISIGHSMTRCGSQFCARNGALGRRTGATASFDPQNPSS